VGQKNKIFKNEPEKLLKTQDRHRKTNPNKPKNEAKNEAGHVVENIRRQKSGLGGLGKGHHQMRARV
jgi:hypothetical protein